MNPDIKFKKPAAGIETRPAPRAVYGTRPVEIVRYPMGLVEEDAIAEECPVALVYNGISHAVMMVSPGMYEEFALGFSLSEGIVSDVSEVYGIDVAETCLGREINIEVSSRAFMALKEHRRSMVGRTGCGLCGTESLRGVRRALPALPFTQTFSMDAYDRARCYLDETEELGRLTGCTHAAVWVSPDGRFEGGAEDVGRHVALDKLLGLRARLGWGGGALFVSSRASYEMVQKAVATGVEIMFAVSAPTAMAVDMARRSNLTLCAFSRRGRTNVYSHPERLLGLVAEG